MITLLVAGEHPTACCLASSLLSALRIWLTLHASRARTSMLSHYLNMQGKPNIFIEYLKQSRVGELAQLFPGKVLLCL
jgi:hypothetical protein